MAKSISITSGSILIGNPITVSVEAETAGSKATFHRVKLIVRAALSTSADYEVFELSAPAGDGEIVSFDISDTLRTVAGRFAFAPVTSSYTYPYISYKLSAYDEYMREGILYDKVGEREYAGTLSALMGAFTDAERFLSGNSKALTAYTRKPAVGEVCSKDDILVYSPAPASGLTVTSSLSSGPTAYTMSLSDKSGPVEVGGRTVYVDTASTGRMLFQFVNGLGVVESVSAETCESLSSSGSNETVVRSSPSAFGSPGRMFVRKSARRASFKCATGFVTPEWAAWWHNEFLCSDDFRRSLSDTCWVRLDGKWFPCAVYMEDDITLYDRAKNDPVSINFTVQLIFDGLYYPRI